MLETLERAEDIVILIEQKKPTKAEAINAMAKLTTGKQRRGYRFAHQKATPHTTTIRIQPASQHSFLFTLLRDLLQMLSSSHDSSHLHTSPSATSRA